MAPSTCSIRPMRDPPEALSRWCGRRVPGRRAGARCGELGPTMAFCRPAQLPAIVARCVTPRPWPSIGTPCYPGGPRPARSSCCTHAARRPQSRRSRGAWPRSRGGPVRPGRRAAGAAPGGDLPDDQRHRSTERPRGRRDHPARRDLPVMTINQLKMVLRIGAASLQFQRYIFFFYAKLHHRFFFADTYCSRISSFSIIPLNKAGSNACSGAEKYEDLPVTAVTMFAPQILCCSPGHRPIFPLAAAAAARAASFACIACIWICGSVIMR